MELREYLSVAPESPFEHKLNLENVPTLAKLEKSKVLQIASTIETLQSEVTVATSILSANLEIVQSSSSLSKAFEAISAISSKLEKFIENFADIFSDEYELFTKVKLEVTRISRLEKLVLNEAEGQRRLKNEPTEETDEVLENLLKRIMFGYQETLATSSSLSEEPKALSEGIRCLITSAEKLTIPENEVIIFKNHFEASQGHVPRLFEFMTFLNSFCEISDSVAAQLLMTETVTINLLDKVSTVGFLVLSRGFCLPEDIADDVLEREGEEVSGGGAGGGEAGDEDVTEQFDEEDLEDPLEGDSKAEKNDRKEEDRGEGIQMENGMDDADDVEVRVQKY